MSALDDRGTVSFLHAGDSRNFAPGDMLGGGQMVLKVDHAKGRMMIGKATWWRKARVWLRAQLIDGWRWLRCTLADAWYWLTRGRP